MPSRFFGFKQNGSDLDMPSAAIVMAELDLTIDAGTNAATHDRAARTQANLNMVLDRCSIKRRRIRAAVEESSRKECEQGQFLTLIGC
jgi:hypothetical protein